ncbi:MAG: decaprenyl-phosphate phosphoribosyltransferase [Candidatus Cloacimonetes bacterium]|nr:decaprenyl-phosphate phosphoribosyltransferase [Candidatus Cloacimonadota bacterium]
MKTILNLFISLRPKQWSKNFFVFAALVFARELFNLPLLEKTLIAFFIFCLLSSGVYLINDICDINEDRKHPTKRSRPIAAGKISVKLAILTAVILLVSGLSTAYLVLNTNFFCAVAIFVFLNFAYSFFLKKIAILDVLLVAVSFVLRALSGGLAISVFVSPWLLVCTFFLALFLVLGKRRGDRTDGMDRTNKYTAETLDRFILVSATAALLSYVLYSILSETAKLYAPQKLFYTVPFATFGIFRYFYLVYQKDHGANPTEVLLSDAPLIINLILWFVLVVIILYNTVNL